MTGPVCLFFDDPLPDELTDPRRELGGKGFSLRQLHAAGVRVPRGFTICAWVCREFLAKEDWPEGAWSAVASAVDRLARQRAGTAADQSAAPAESCPRLRLAVRSGAAVSMPGLLRTLLDVPCDSSLDTAHTLAPLRGAIEEVFRSWTAAAAERYRRQMGIDRRLATGVTVQEMIACTASGVLFTRASDAAEDALVIEAVSGLGDALVSGRATPVRWRVRRQDRRVLETPGPGAELPDGLASVLPELIETGLRLEAEFGQPLDIEWGLDGGGLVFFQARPIDEAPADGDVPTIRQKELERLRALAAAGARGWVRHNLSETLPHPRPLTWSVWQSFMSAGGGLGALYRQLGYRPDRRQQNESFLTLIGGQIYADPDRAAAMFGRAWPWSYDLVRLREDPSLLDQPPRQFDPQRLDPWFLWRLPSLAWQVWRSNRRIAALTARAAADFEEQTVPRLLAFVAAERQTDLTQLGAADLLQQFEQRRRVVMDEFAPRSLLPGTLGAIALAELSRQAARVLGPDEAASLVREITPAGDVELVRRQHELLTRWNDPQARSAFFEEFGHRAIGEMELAVPRWRETPELIAEFAAHQPAAVGPTPQPMTHQAAHEQLRRAFADCGAESLLGDAVHWLDHCWRLLPYRDRARHLWLKGYELLRHVAHELSQRSELGERFYYLTAAEWPDLIAGRDLRARIHERRREAAAFRNWHIPAFIDAVQPEQPLAAAPSSASGADLQGTPLSTGYGEGRVFTGGGFANGSGDAARVFVCDSLDPSMVPLLAGTSAVVVQQGGALSHGAILARQMGLPVVRLADAIRCLSEGQRVGVDGRTGCVQLLEGEKP